MLLFFLISYYKIGFEKAASKPSCHFNIIERKANNISKNNPKILSEEIKQEKEILPFKVYKTSYSFYPKKISFTKDHGVSVDNYNQTYPSIAFDSRGNLYVAMDYYNGSTYEIDIYRSIDYGDNWELLFYLYNSSYNYRYPHIVIDHRDTILVFYETNDTRYGFQYLSSPDGDKWTLYYVSSYTFYPDSCDYPRAAVKDSLIFVTFMFDYYGNGSDYDVGYLYSTNYGNSWYDYHDGIAYSTRHERFPSVAISDSVVGVVYEYNNASADTDSFDIMYKYTRNFTTWNSLYGIATYHNDRYPDITSKGRYLFITCQRNYYSKPARDWDIVMRRSVDGGKNWESSSYFAVGSIYDEKFPSIFSSFDTIFLGYIYKDSLILFAETTGVASNWFSDTVSDLKTAVSQFRCVDISRNSNQRMSFWVDRRHNSYLPNIGYDIYFSTDYPITKDCDIAIYKPVDWSNYLIPSKVKGTHNVSDTLIGSPYNGTDSTYIDFALISNSPVDIPDTFYCAIYVDGILKEEFYSLPLPTGWYAYAEDWSTLVMGGRHTLSVSHDYLDSIIETDESNNDYGKQYVFLPITLSDKVPRTYKTPPLPQTTYSPPDTFNCDGFRVSTAVYWGAVGIKPPSSADYQLRVYSDHYVKSDTTKGFTDLKKESNYGTDLVDFILLDGNHLGSGNYFYPGVYKVAGDGDYIIEWNMTDYSLGTSGWNAPDTIPGGSILKVYDVYLTGGTKYYIAVKETLTNENLGFGFFSSEDGKYYKARGEWVAFRDTITQDITKDTAYTPLTTDWFGLIVWNNNPSSKGQAIFKVYISSVPLINELADFSINVSGNEVLILWNSSLIVENWIIQRLNLQDEKSVEFTLRNNERVFKDKIDRSGDYRYSLYYTKNGERHFLTERTVHIDIKTFLVSNLINNNLTIFSSGKELDIILYTISGTKIYQNKLTPDKARIYNLDMDIPSGIYFLKVMEEQKEIINTKLVKF